MTQPLVLSLFPGIGLLDMAFEFENFCVVRGPDVLWGGDVRRFFPPTGCFDGVIGGPPCQSFSSLVHLVRANGHEPKFGNLIPEFERCVLEAQPRWFLMENVPQAPVPFASYGGGPGALPQYGINTFLLDNSALNDGTGFGLEQRRVRRFTFGLRDTRDVPCLMRWVDLAVFLLPDAVGSVTSQPVDNSDEAKGRTSHECINGSHGVPPSKRDKVRRQALLRDAHAVPVAIGGSGKRKPGARVPPSEAGHAGGTVEDLNARRRKKAVSSITGGNGDGERGRVTPGAGNAGKGRYRFADALRLQGLPEDFLADAPFTADGKLKAVANGVPIPMGLAIARAVKCALLTIEPTKGLPT
jgi:site-specific DNA-cytosine methylase